MTDQTSESAIAQALTCQFAPAQTYRFANEEETITPSETTNSENLSIGTVAESSPINPASSLPDELPSNPLKADVQDSPSVILSESLLDPSSEQSEVTTQTSEGAIAQAPTCRFAHIEDSLFISDAINSGKTKNITLSRFVMKKP